MVVPVPKRISSDLEFPAAVHYIRRNTYHYGGSLSLSIKRTCYQSISSVLPSRSEDDLLTLCLNDWYDAVDGEAVDLVLFNQTSAFFTINP